MPKTKNEPTVVYQERLVAFMDILGFSRMLDQSKSKIENQQKIFEF